MWSGIRSQTSGFIKRERFAIRWLSNWVCGRFESKCLPSLERLDPVTSRASRKTKAKSATRFQCDLTSKEGIESISKFIRQSETHLDILVSNAGIRRDPPKSCNVLTAPLEELQASLWSSEYDDWTKSFQINTMAHYFLSVALLDLLAGAAEIKMPDGSKGRDHGRGVVVVTSSCASMHNATNVDMMSYATTKAATDHLVSLLAVKFARWYVRVCGINPGCKHPPSTPNHPQFEN